MGILGIVIGPIPDDSVAQTYINISTAQWGLGQ